MENKEAAMTIDKSETGRTNEVPTDRPQTDANGIPKQDIGSANYTSEFYTYPKSGDNVARKEAPHPSGDVNMEATINSDDVIRAGGFGARDDLSSFLPVASDSTDFEASLLDARDYEEPQGERHRPGLGEFGTRLVYVLLFESSYLKQETKLRANVMKWHFLCGRFFALVQGLPEGHRSVFFVRKDPI